MTTVQIQNDKQATTLFTYIHTGAYIHTYVHTWHPNIQYSNFKMYLTVLSIYPPSKGSYFRYSEPHERIIINSNFDVHENITSPPNPVLAAYETSNIKRTYEREGRGGQTTATHPRRVAQCRPLNALSHPSTAFPLHPNPYRVVPETAVRKSPP